MSAVRALSFTAWRLPELGDTIPIDLPDTLDSLGAAVNAALSHACFHRGEALLIVERDGAKSRSTLHIHVIRERQRREYRRNPITGRETSFKPLYADKPISCPILAFGPVERWQLPSNGDATGFDRQLVEG